MFQLRLPRNEVEITAAEAVKEGGFGAAEQRSHVRHVTMLRVATLHTQGSKELCVVKNISAGGLSARVYRSFDVGESVEVELRFDERIHGTVQWVREFEVGIAFPEEIDVASVLTSRWVTEDGRRQRLPRIEVDCRCRLRVGSRFYLASLLDVSQGGAKLRTERPFQGIGDAILTLPELGSLEGSVRWSQGNRVGLSFNERLPFELLVRWIQARRHSAEAGAAQVRSLT